MTAVLDRQAVLDSARRHANNYEAVAFELDSDPETIAQIVGSTVAPTNGHAATQVAVQAKPRKPCADPECPNDFVPTSNVQKYCKDDACKRRRWAREKREQTGHKPKPAAARPAPPAPVTPSQEPPSDLAGRYVAALLERALSDLTPEQARTELERIAGLAA